MCFFDVLCYYLIKSTDGFQQGFSPNGQNSKLLKKRGRQMNGRKAVLAAALAALLAAAVLLPLFRPFWGRERPADILPPLVTAPAQVRPRGEDPLDLNTADIRALQTLPGIGPARAQRILDYREAHGPFRSVEELAAVEGIGPALVEQLREAVTAASGGAP